MSNELISCLQKKWSKILLTNILTFKPSWIIHNLEGKHNFKIILNKIRIQQKRKSSAFRNADEPYNPSSFNFNKIRSTEVAHEIDFSELFKTPYILKIIYNIAPAMDEHYLIIPAPTLCSNQRAHFNDLCAVLLMIHKQTFKGVIGLNSVGGCASVNHQHYQFFIQFPGDLTILKWLHNRNDNRFKDFYCVTDYFLPFFCAMFQNHISKSLVKTIIHITDNLTSKGISYNIMILRDQLNIHDENLYLILYPRKAIFGSSTNIDNSFTALSGVCVSDDITFDEEAIISFFKEIAIDSDTFHQLSNQAYEFYSNSLSKEETII